MFLAESGDSEIGQIIMGLIMLGLIIWGITVFVKKVQGGVNNIVDKVKGNSEDIARLWSQIRTGMAADAVIAILGSPDEVSATKSTARLEELQADTRETGQGTQEVRMGATTEQFVHSSWEEWSYDYGLLAGGTVTFSGGTVVGFKKP
jgi:hypothetical protein